jgi:uncharacterized protein
MINISVKSSEDTIELNAQGHANAAPKGEDVVCAAATILIRTLAKTLEAAVPDMVKADIKNGKASISVTGYDPVAAVAIETVCTGFRLLQEQYPEHIKIFAEK